MTRTVDWQALSAALDESLELSTVARAEWLTRLEKTSPDIAERVRALLARRHDAAERGFLEGVADATLIARATPALIGTRIGPYAIEAEAGRGGMGSVWRARRMDGHYEGVVAIKFLNLAALDMQGERRFRREGLLLGKLDHPNVARLLDAGVQSDTNQPYLVLEFVDGVPIDDYCNSQAVSLRARLELFIEVLNAVTHAHSHLVIHGDIKPSNILVTRAGVPKLLDFGIARLADDESDATRSSLSPLTPQYAAPEQVLGDFITTRTDIYGLGLVLYRLLAGQHAVQTDERRGSTWLADVLERDPPAPSSVLSGNTIRRQELAGDLDNIVSKAIRKAPAQRYQTAAAFAEDLQRYLRHEPVTARRDTVGYRVGKFVRRHRGGVASAVLTVIALLGATIVTTRQMIEARHQRDAAVEASRRADATANFLQLVLAENRPAAKPLTVDELLDRAVQLLEMQYGGNRAFVSDIYMLLAGERGGRNEVDKARQLLELAVASAHQAQDPALELRANCQLADLEGGEGFKDAARKRLERAGWKTGQYHPDWQTHVQCLRADANIAGGDSATRDESLRFLETAKARIESAGMTHDRAYTSVISFMAVRYRGKDDLARAYELVKLGGRIHEENGRGATRSRLLALNNEAVMLWDMGEIRASHELRTRLMQHVATLEPDGFGPFSVNYGISALRMQDYELARRQIDAAIDAAVKRGDTITELGARMRRLGLLLRTAAPRAEVDAAFAAIAKLMASPDRKIPDDIQYDLAEAHARRDAEDGKLGKARTDMAAALANAEKKTRKRYIFRALRLSAQLALDDGQPAAAIEFAKRGVPIARGMSRTEDSSADLGELLLVEARATAALGKPEAQSLFEHAIRCFDNGYGPAHPQTLEAKRVLEDYLKTRTPAG